MSYQLISYRLSVVSYQAHVDYSCNQGRLTVILVPIAVNATPDNGLQITDYGLRITPKQGRLKVILVPLAANATPDYGLRITDYGLLLNQGRLKVINGQEPGQRYAG